MVAGMVGQAGSDRGLEMMYDVFFMTLLYSFRSCGVLLLCCRGRPTAILVIL